MEGETIAFDMMQKYVPLIMRVSIGIVLVWLGVSKFVSESFQHIVTASGVMIMEPLTLAIVLGIIELLLGVLLVIGLLTRLTAALCSLVFIGYIIVVMVWGSMMPVYLGLLGSSLALVIRGAGDMSLDQLLRA